MQKIEFLNNTHYVNSEEVENVPTFREEKQNKDDQTISSFGPQNKKELNNDFEIRESDYIPVTIKYNFDFGLTNEYNEFLNEKNSFTEGTSDSEIFTGLRG